MQNPIDKDKITETPATLEYAHHVGSAVIKPIDKGRIKGRAMAAMVEQTNKQMEQIQVQMKLLIDQAKTINRRVELSELIYNAEIGFAPLVGHIYYMYQKDNGVYSMSMLTPEEWGRSLKHTFVSEVKLMADHTWEVLNDTINLNDL